MCHPERRHGKREPSIPNLDAWPDSVETLQLPLSHCTRDGLSAGSSSREEADADQHNDPSPQDVLLLSNAGLFMLFFSERLRLGWLAVSQHQKKRTAGAAADVVWQFVDMTRWILTLRWVVIQASLWSWMFSHHRLTVHLFPKNKMTCY